MIIKRVIFDIILFLSIFIFPWWVSLFLVAVGIFLFNNFYEFIVSSLIIYCLFAVGGGRFISSPIYFSLIIIFTYIFIQFIRSNMILYKK